MQCCEFEMVLEYLRLEVEELGVEPRYHRLELAAWKVRTLGPCRSELARE